MVICICANVSDRAITERLSQGGVERLSDLQRELGICRQCGCCAEQALTLLRQGQAGQHTVGANA